MVALRQALKQNPQRRRVVVPQSLPAPVGGWNARDSIADMDEKDAITLRNWFPTASDVLLRKGIDDYATGIGTPSEQVESLMAYSTPGGTAELYAAAGTSFYDVSAAGAVGAAVVTGLTNARWYHTNFTNSSGDSYLTCFNGADNPQYWDGSSWTAITGVSTPAITGVTTTGLIFPWQHKRRMWVIESATLKAWYLPVDAVGGAASALDLSGIAKHGGFLMCGATWTIDGGEGMDDYWVAVTSEGEVIVYKGTDPSDASTWALVGVWKLGRPLGRRCLVKYAGDLLYAAEDGLWPLSRALISAQVNPRVALTDKIVNAVNGAATTYYSNFGWQVIFYPQAPFILLNVPVTEGMNQVQYVMNTITGAWCDFSDWEANCWELFAGALYFGGNGAVVKAWSGFDDNGSNVDGLASQAFNYFGSRGRRKRFLQARPIISTNGTPTAAFGVNTDYQEGDPTGTLTFSGVSYALWGVSKWGVGLWGTGLYAFKNWLGITGVGMCASPRLKVASAGLEVRWQATDITYEMGEVI